jgi:hypothetical protein
LAQQLPPEDRARMECMIAQARQAICEARLGRQHSLEQQPTTRTVVLRFLAKEAHRKSVLCIMDDCTRR